MPRSGLYLHLQVLENQYFIGDMWGVGDMLGGGWGWGGNSPPQDLVFGANLSRVCDDIIVFRVIGLRKGGKRSHGQLPHSPPKDSNIISGFAISVWEALISGSGFIKVLGDIFVSMKQSSYNHWRLSSLSTLIMLCDSGFEVGSSDKI